MSTLDALPSLVGPGPDQPPTVAIPAGDLDGDGRGDLVVGIPSDDVAGDASGAAYIVYDVAAIGPLTPILDVGVRLAGERPADRAGFAVAALGDADGDGYDDVAASAPEASGVYTAEGRIYVLYGGDRAVSGSLRDRPAFVGADRHARAGIRLFGPGDIDGDGLADLLVGAPYPTPSGVLGAGWVALMRGREGGWPDGLEIDVSADLTTEHTSADAGFLVRASNSLLGRSAAVIPDVDGDGLDDLVVGAPGYDPQDRSDDVGHGPGAAVIFPMPDRSIANAVVTDAQLLGRIDGAWDDDGLAWGILGLPGGGFALSGPEHAIATGQVWRFDKVSGVLSTDDADATWVGDREGAEFGLGMAPIDLFGGELAIGQPGFGDDVRGRVIVVGQSGGPLTDANASLEGCWDHGQVGSFIGSGPGPDPTGADAAWTAITAPGSSVAAHEDGLVYVLTAGDAATTSAPCGTDSGWVAPIDIDGDGYAADVDCDDTEAHRYPGAPEVCGDGIDDDCDGVADNGCPDTHAGCGCASGGTPMSGLGAVAAAVVAVTARRRRTLAVLVALGLSAGARADDRPLDALPIATLYGATAYGSLRGPVLGGDFDGDGAGDLAVADYQGIVERYDTGAVFLVPHDRVRGPVDLLSATVLAGDSEHDRFGIAAIVIPRLAPGLPDGLLVGADHTGLTELDQGQALLWRAPLTGPPLTVAADADYAIGGDDNEDAFGQQLAVGDFDGDGVQDVAIAAPFRDTVDGDVKREHTGRVWIVHGGPSGPYGARLIKAIATATIDAANADTYAGWRLVCPGDLDGDGRDDLIVGSIGGTPRAAGRLAYFSGVDRGQALLLDQSSGAWVGRTADARFGESIAVGEVNGHPSVFVGSPRTGLGGRVWRFDAPPQGLVGPDQAADAIWSGPDASGAGTSLAIGPRVLVGAPENGNVYVLDDALTGDLVIVGGGRTGETVSWIPDVDGDGTDDAAIVDPAYSGDRINQGRAVILSGARIVDGDLPLGDPPDDFDSDGSIAGVDCDDGDPRRAPGNPEICRTGIDENCDGQVDESCGCSVVHLSAGGGWIAMLALAMTRRRRVIAVPILAGCAGGPAVEAPVLDIPDSPLFGVVHGSATGDADRLIVAVDGTEIAGGPGPEVRFPLDTRDLDDGPHLLRASAFTGEDEADTWVEVDVKQVAGDREPPRVRFLEPREGEVFVGTDPYIILDVGDDVGIAHVEVRIGDVLLGALPPEGPYEIAWENAPSGDWRIVAAAVDHVDHLTTAAIRVAVGERQ